MESGQAHAWTLEELQEALEQSGTPTSFSSVFRAAHQAVERGHWRKVILEEGPPRFEPALRHHDHLRCERCGALEAVPCHLTARVRGRIERATGYKIRNHTFLWQGLCPDCRKASPRTPGGQGSRPKSRAARLRRSSRSC